MSYLTVSIIKQDPWIRDRVSACVATEDLPERPEDCPLTHSWQLAAQPGWSAAWESAMGAHEGEQGYLPGRDEAVITDGMILSAVQVISGAVPEEAEPTDPEPDPDPEPEPEPEPEPADPEPEPTDPEEPEA